MLEVLLVYYLVSKLIYLIKTKMILFNLFYMDLSLNLTVRNSNFLFLVGAGTSGVHVSCVKKKNLSCHVGRRMVDVDIHKLH